MKTRTLLTTTVFFLCSIILQAQTTTIPDANFEQALIDLGIDSDVTINQSVATSDISGITTLDVSSKNINDLTGIEGFISLTKLICYSNQLISLDLTQNTALTYLRCNYNPLTSLDVTQSTALTHLYCYTNQLTSLDVTQNTALTQLDCYNNPLTSLDVTQNTSLKILYCFSNQLTSLDVTQNTALTKFYCNQNQLTSLDVTQNTDLSWLKCYNNQLTSLDITQNTDLYVLECHTNQLTSLDVIQHTALGYLSCYNNQLTSLDVTQNTDLKSLNCHSNQLTSLDITQNTALTNLYCNNNQLTSLDVSNNTALKYFNCGQNQLTSLDVTQNTALIWLMCYRNPLTSLDVTQNTALTHLYCDNNQLTSLDVSNNTALTYFNCEHNQLTSLDVSNSPALISLGCEQNQLTSLDVPSSPALTHLTCSYNQLTSLDVSNNPALTHLICQYNQLTSLDVSSSPALTHLTCSCNQLTSIDVSGNPALIMLECYVNHLTSLNVKNGNNTNIRWFRAKYNPYLSCIQVDDPAYSTANWPSKDATATYMEYCNMPPIADCQDVTVVADGNCEGLVTPEQVDDGSYDPDGDPITLSLDPTGPYPLGETSVTLTVEDSSGETDQCMATVTVVDVTAPVITSITEPIVIWPPNHQYETFAVSDFVSSVVDNCTSLTINDVNIAKATSDEPENPSGGGDGNTLNDIVIANDCKSIQLRKERKAGDNGRVYTIHLELDDGNGNTGSATCQVQVPPNNNGTAIDDGPVYIVSGNCGNGPSFPVGNKNAESEIKLTNYPNPFNSSTTFVFSVEEANKTTLKLYNPIGKEVKVLFDGYAEADQNYEIIFTGEGLPGGLYICHMQTGERRCTKRIVLAR